MNDLSHHPATRTPIGAGCHDLKEAPCTRPLIEADHAPAESSPDAMVNSGSPGGARPTWFRRAGRKRRGRIDEILAHEPSTGCLKVKAGWPYTQPLWITQAEIAAGTKEEQPKPKLR